MFAMISVLTILLWVLMSMMYRVVVSTNDVHIVQSSKKTVSYGKDQDAGNTYYAWPSWIPVIGIKVIKLPVSVFDVQLDAYAAYDKGRVPFLIDIMAFFRIDNSNDAAQRVHSFDELRQQLEGILQGACRSILAKSEIEEILEERSKFGSMFTVAVNEQLKAWGVTNVKNIELMDIRDANGSKVIENIMAKKKSLIEMESRIAVATNLKSAQTAEIDAKREVQMREQDALEQVGRRTAEKDQAVGIAHQHAEQAIKQEERVTAEKHMAVVQVNTVRQAEISKEVQIVSAEQEKATAVIKAEGQKQQTILVAEGMLEGAKRHAEGVEAEGRAAGEAEKAMQLAPVQAQIVLAKEIGGNEGYQKYLVSVRQIEATQAVGTAQAEALKDAQIKVIANAGTIADGMNGVTGILSASGGTHIGAMIEAFANTEAGGKIVEAVTGKKKS